jgi:hypothetical protein
MESNTFIEASEIVNNINLLLKKDGYNGRFIFLTWNEMENLGSNIEHNNKDELIIEQEETIEWLSKTITQLNNNLNRRRNKK